VTKHDEKFDHYLKFWGKLSEEIIMNKIRLVIVLCLSSILFLMSTLAYAADITLYYPPEWKAKVPQANAIAQALTKSSGLKIKPCIANSYPEIVSAFSQGQPMLVYVGSFLQAVLYARQLSVPIVQGIDGKELYSSVLIAPALAGSDPVKIVDAAGVSVAYAKGSSSGESGAKAATRGKAAIPTNDHFSAVYEIKSGKAKCAFVKDWWWKANKNMDIMKGMQVLDYPGVSDLKNADNILSANKMIAPKDIEKIKAAVNANANVFQVKSFKEFTPALLEPSLALMKKGNINPKNYTW
jgi:hypothetical protein